MKEARDLFAGMIYATEYDRVHPLEKRRVNEKVEWVLAFARRYAEREEWTCPDCAFSFNREHVDEATGGYSCPLCAEAKLERENKELREERDRLQAKYESACRGVSRNADKASEYFSDLASSRERVKEVEQHLGNLLSRIHGDGGHYISYHGWEKAVEDADKLVVEGRERVKELEDTLQAVLDSHTTDSDHCAMCGADAAGKHFSGCVIVSVRAALRPSEKEGR